jgi:hypothetical protein
MQVQVVVALVLLVALLIRQKAVMVEQVLQLQ